MIFDAHCDTIYELREKNLELYRNSIHLDIERIIQTDTYIQVFAAYIDKKNIKVSPMNECLSLINRYYSELKKNKDIITPILTLSDIEKTKNGGIYSILAIEGGEALEGSLNTLDMYFRLGVRLITLTWNYENEIADGVLGDRGRGLTDFGIEAVHAMEELGIVIDVSHLSEKGFWDVVEYTKKPFVASHSCAYNLCKHPRNLKDKQIDAIIKRGGCIGVNFYPEFLCDNKTSSVSDIIRHIEYIISRGGEHSVGIGSDFDGVACLPKDMHGVSDIPKLFSMLKDRGFTESQINKISFENFYRVFSEVLKNI